MLSFSGFFNKFNIFSLVKTDEIAFEFTLNLCLTLGNIFFSAFLFEPLSDFAACLAGLDNIEPVTAGTLALLRRGHNLNNFACFDLIVKRNDFAVNLRTYHLVADSGVDCIGKVDYRCTRRQAENIALGSENKHFLGNKVAFDC